MNGIRSWVSGAAAAAALAVTSVGASQATTANSFVVSIPAAACPHEAPPELCATSLPIDLTDVKRFRFHVRGSGYDISDSADKPVVLEYFSTAGSSWSCLGTLPCRGVTIQNLPPDQFGNTQKIYSSPMINLPAHQRTTTQVRLPVVGNIGAPVITQTSVQFFY
jgi:hypothetical protein